MKLNVKIDFDIEGDEELDEDEIKEMIMMYLSERIENDELEYNTEVIDEDDGMPH